MNYWEFWIPILKKQYFKYRIMNDKSAIKELEKNILKNWNLSDKDKNKILNSIKGKKERGKTWKTQIML